MVWPREARAGVAMAEEDEDIAKLDAMEETSSVYHVEKLGLSVCNLQGHVRVYMGARPEDLQGWLG